MSTTFFMNQKYLGLERAETETPQSGVSRLGLSSTQCVEEVPSSAPKPLRYLMQ